MNPADHTLEILHSSKCWAAASIYVESAVLMFQGTRSQSMKISARILAVSDTRIASPLNIEQYVADHAVLETGVSYVVILICDIKFDGTDTWKVVQASPLKDVDPHHAVIDTFKRTADALNSRYGEYNAEDSKSLINDSRDCSDNESIIQIGDISKAENRIRITGHVISGNVSKGDRLDAAGLETLPVIVDEAVAGG